ncbi:hypothetical protein GCM10010400_10050 [Streptomyces aculeolatus]
MSDINPDINASGRVQPTAVADATNAVATVDAGCPHDRLKSGRSPVRPRPQPQHMSSKNAPSKITEGAFSCSFTPTAPEEPKPLVSVLSQDTRVTASFRRVPQASPPSLVRRCRWRVRPG